MKPTANTGLPAKTYTLAIAAFVVGHIVLAWGMRSLPFVATAHALLCVAAGVLVAARRPLYQTAYVAGYIAGAEVLWRMNRAGVFWEYGKYAVCVVLIVALTRVQLRRNVGLALGYLALLLPSVILTVLAVEGDLARQVISFNLSGPLSLALCVVFFSNLRLSSQQLVTTFFATIAPIVAIAAISYFSTVSAADLAFNGQSNAITSGGFGPNQVSAMLGLGMLLAFLMLFGRMHPPAMRWPLIVLGVVLGAQCALTFSRGGLVVALGGLLAAMFYLVRSSRTRITLFLVATLVTAVANYVVIPRLDNFTQGKLVERYTNTRVSNRDTLARADLEIFADNIALGVGPGVASTIRNENGDRVAAHTEFTRSLAEHGLLGALAMILLGVLGFRTIVQTRSLLARALVASMLVWFVLFLLINAMRIAAPSFLFGLACSIAYSSVPRPRPPAPATLAPASVPIH
ncbi:MAG: O-antigen ligase family protein [Deltaproteobacteria bacterium]|nr:O-antigen ligase family protein [Deltaproteobacteria bacterium]